MKELAPGYKPVVVGDETMPDEIENSLFSTQFIGLQVKTDSLELSKQLILAGGASLIPSDQNYGTFRYLTEVQPPLVTASGEPIRATSETHPGEMYASSDLENFYFYGRRKLGTLASMAYGIRSLGVISDGKLGLHSSLIFDQTTEAVTLIIGRDNIGKSTIVQAIEDSDERFLMVADDWSEVELATGIVTPISPVFSPGILNSRYEEAFTSYGKSFYFKDLPATLPESLVLSRVVELHDNDDGSGQNTFILRSLRHIPFIRQNIDEATFACASLDRAAITSDIEDKKKSIVNAYRNLVEEYDTAVVYNDHSKNSIDEATIKIRDILE